MAGAEPVERALEATCGTRRAEDAATGPELRVQRLRAAVDGCAWASIVLGLAFTTVNVQRFGAAGAAVYSAGWWVAWLLDPIPSLLLIAVLLTEQVTARWQIQLGGWVAVTKWVTFAATAGMNTWSAVAVGSGADIFTHVVPPLMVFLGAQVAPILRDALTAAVTAATAQHPAPTSCTGPSSESLPAEGERPDAVAIPGTPARSRATAPTPDGEPEPAVPESGQRAVPAGPVADPRVAELARRLAAGEELTGPAAAVALGCSQRNARRLLTQARDLDTTGPLAHPIADPVAGSVADTAEGGARNDPRRALHVIGRTS